MALEERLRSWKAFGERLIGAIRSVKYKPAAAMKIAPPDPSRLAELQGMMQTLEPEAQQVAVAVVRETMMAAPWMAPRVLYKVALQIDKLRALEYMRNRLRKRIEIEKAPGYQHRILSAVQIPRDFKRLYQEQFRMTLNWLLEGLEDHRGVPEGLIRIWKDFVIRYGSTFQKFEDIHIVSLRELADRTIEQGNGGQFSNTRTIAQVENLNSTGLRFLSEQIIYAVEQDLKSEKSENLSNVTLGPSSREAASVGVRP
jgi:hypothetical protein